MIYVGLGSNLPSAAGSPLNAVKSALSRFLEFGITVVKVSHWYESAPVPASDQPWFVNGIAAVDTKLEPADLLATLLAIEREFGRQRGEINAARPLDLDLIDYKGVVLEDELILPHPRLHQRSFVLYPLRDVAADWVHPLFDLNIEALLAQYCGDSEIRRLGETNSQRGGKP